MAEYTLTYRIGGTYARAHFTDKALAQESHKSALEALTVWKDKNINYVHFTVHQPAQRQVTLQSQKFTTGQMFQTLLITQPLRSTIDITFEVSDFSTFSEV